MIFHFSLHISVFKNIFKRNRKVFILCITLKKISKNEKKLLATITVKCNFMDIL